MRDRHKATTNTIHLFTKRDTNTISTINLSLEGYSQSPLTRGITQIKEGLQLSDQKTTNQFLFPQKQRSYREDRMIAKVWKTKSLKIKNSKKNSREKL